MQGSSRKAVFLHVEAGLSVGGEQHGERERETAFEIACDPLSPAPWNLLSLVRRRRWNFARVVTVLPKKLLPSVYLPRLRWTFPSSSPFTRDAQSLFFLLIHHLLHPLKRLSRPDTHILVARHRRRRLNSLDRARTNLGGFTSQLVCRCLIFLGRRRADGEVVRVMSGELGGGRGGNRRGSRAIFLVSSGCCFGAGSC